MKLAQHQLSNFSLCLSLMRKMMASPLLPYYLLFSIQITLFSKATGQGYNSVHIEKGKQPDADNQIFIPGRAFVYQVTIYEMDKEKKLAFRDKDWTLKDSGDVPALNRVDEVIYLTANVKRSKRTNKQQTEVIIAYEPQGKTFQNTGIVENDQNIWLHPPRSSFFRILEICPFPYVRFWSPSRRGATR
ncbi:MAG: hypothetical protein AAF616_06500 [Bacteroidota bacterium]